MTTMVMAPVRWLRRAAEWAWGAPLSREAGAAREAYFGAEQRPADAWAWLAAEALPQRRSQLLSLMSEDMQLMVDVHDVAFGRPRPVVADESDPSPSASKALLLCWLGYTELVASWQANDPCTFAELLAGNDHIPAPWPEVLPALELLARAVDPAERAALVERDLYAAVPYDPDHGLCVYDVLGRVADVYLALASQRPVRGEHR